MLPHDQISAPKPTPSHPVKMHCPASRPAFVGAKGEIARSKTRHYANPSFSLKRALCLSSPSSGGVLKEANDTAAPDLTEVLERCTKRARMAGIRRHWVLAKKLSPSISATDLKNWFVSAFEDNHVPECPVKRLLWLIEVRTIVTRNNDRLTRLKIDAAIWNETRRARRQHVDF